MKAMLCGEGAHEIGQNHWSKRHQRWETSRGWMQEIVDSAVGVQVEYDLRLRKDLMILPRDGSRFRPLPPGHGAKALASALLAQSVGASVSIFMADADSNSPEDMNVIQEQILAGFAAAKDAGIAVEGIACVPMASSESWLLADEASWLEVAGTQPSLPDRPEEIWGARNDPDGDHPKHVFRRATSSARLDDSAATRNRLAAAANVNTIARKCPASFATFCTELRKTTEQGIV